ncbi:MAG: hypothetical protein RLZZ612_2122 [Pseudomonadota bacterium]
MKKTTAPDTSAHTPEMTVYYDESCPICRAEMHNFMRRDRSHIVTFVDASAPDFVPPSGHRTAEMMRLLHLHTADGRWLIGVDAFSLLYRRLGLPWVARALDAPVLRPLAEWLYPVVAEHRQRIPRWVARLVFERGAHQAATQAHARAQSCADGVCTTRREPS